jgi:hypothetical protein
MKTMISFIKKLIEQNLFSLVVIFITTIYIYLGLYFSEPIHCSAPNMNGWMSIVNNTPEHLVRLSDALASAVRVEIDRRVHLGIRSRVVTMGDIGVGPFYTTVIDSQNRFPGLNDLYASKPEWFVRGSRTNVQTIIERIAEQ